MILHLFYPKELKDLIAELREKDDLNIDALVKFRLKIETFFFISLALTIGSIIYPPMFLLLATLTILMPFEVCKSQMKLYFLPCTKGEKINDAKITKIKHYRGTSKYWLEKDNRRFLMYIPHRLFNKYDQYKKGMISEIYAYKDNAVPNDINLLKDFCLSKSLLQEKGLNLNS